MPTRKDGTKERMNFTACLPNAPPDFVHSDYDLSTPLILVIVMFFLSKLVVDSLIFILKLSQ